MPAFLTQDWFDKVNDITTQAGDLNVPANIKDIAINLDVNDAPDGKNEVAFYDGTLHQGFKAGAPTTLHLDADLLRAIFLEQDMGQAMQAFMSGKIKIDGDMSQLMAIQTATPSAEQKQLFGNIMAITE